MTDDIDFLTVEDVLLIHEQQIEAYGGGAGIRNIAALDSAVATPQASFDGKLLHEDVFAMAAAYAFHVAQNQPFVDGNKRTGLVAALVFLDFNGVVILDPSERLYEAMIAVANHELDKRGLAQLLRELSQVNDPDH